MPCISIIVAVYNAEKTLSRCLDSLVNQSLRDIEIILVDDGSIDSSGSICDRYAATDSRISVYHKENEGVSRTKQFGLDHASGEYIVYLDSDDYVDTGIYHKLYDKAVEEKADIVCCDIMRLENGHSRIDGHNRISSFNHKDFLDGIIDVLFGSICNRIVRRSLLEEYGVKFNPDISFGEDKLVLIELLSKSLASGRELKISYVPEALLYYDIDANPGSLMKLDASNKLVSQIRLWKEMGKYLDLTLFGKTYYQLLVKHGFKHFWNQTVSKDLYSELFSPMRNGIRKYAPTSAQKHLVLLAASGKWDLAQRMKWIAAGRILADKIRIKRERRSSL